MAKDGSPFSIYQEFYTLLRNGELVPGQAFTCRELAKRFNIGVMTIHAAMTALKENGMIVVKPRRQGSYVAEISLEECWSALQHRLTIEVRAAVMACENATDAELRELAKMAYALDCKTPRDSQLRFTAEYDFHRRILEISHIPSLSRQTLPILDCIVKSQLCHQEVEYSKNYWGDDWPHRNRGHLMLAAMMCRRASSEEMTFGMEVHMMNSIATYYPGRNQYHLKLQAFDEAHLQESADFARKIEVWMAEDEASEEAAAPSNANP